MYFATLLWKRANLAHLRVCLLHVLLHSSLC